MEQTPCTLQGARCLVIGYGRIGALLAGKLRALGAMVQVSARSPRDFARIETAGLTALDTRSLAGQLTGFSLIFNTVPAPVLGAAELADLSDGCLIIDLASMPGGISPDATVPSGCRILHALSLPGRVAPLSAAQAIHKTALSILQEEGIL
ncbi:MAG: NAD(P)-dependent oxidoreductase [Agathobaculum sp.]|jgi:dipicolinate synthase subunit A|uniref:NAD(P)-dependent oxidoreductase n=1 Tax=Agathobaculum sp. TaxID=2048138 RepID=UPI003D8AA41C